MRSEKVLLGTRLLIDFSLGAAPEATSNLMVCNSCGSQL